MYYAVSSGLCGGINAQEICCNRIQNRRGGNGNGMITKPLKYTEHKLSLNVKEFVCANRGIVLCPAKPVRNSRSGRVQL